MLFHFFLFTCKTITRNSIMVFLNNLFHKCTRLKVIFKQRKISDGAFSINTLATKLVFKRYLNWATKKNSLDLHNTENIIVKKLFLLDFKVLLSMCIINNAGKFSFVDAALLKTACQHILLIWQSKC